MTVGIVQCKVYSQQAASRHSSREWASFHLHTLPLKQYSPLNATTFNSTSFIARGLKPMELMLEFHEKPSVKMLVTPPHSSQSWLVASITTRHTNPIPIFLRLLCDAGSILLLTASCIHALLIPTSRYTGTSLLLLLCLSNLIDMRT